MNERWGGWVGGYQVGTRWVGGLVHRKKKVMLT